MNHFRSMRCEEKPAKGVLGKIFLLIKEERAGRSSLFSPCPSSFLLRTLSCDNMPCGVISSWTVKVGITNAWILAECREQNQGLDDIVEPLH